MGVWLQHDETERAGVGIVATRDITDLEISDTRSARLRFGKNNQVLVVNVVKGLVHQFRELLNCNQ